MAAITGVEDQGGSLVVHLKKSGRVPIRITQRRRSRARRIDYNKIKEQRREREPRSTNVP